MKRLHLAEIARQALRMLDRGKQMSVGAMVDAIRGSDPAEVVLVNTENEADRELVEMIPAEARVQMREAVDDFLSVDDAARKFGIERNGWAFLAALMVEILETE